MIAASIKRARVRAGLTQEILASKLNTSRSVIAQYETGYRTPSLKRLRDIAKILNTNMDTLTK